MRVFVTGTGRCGTTTFSKACSHITNFTSGHETKWGPRAGSSLEFPDNHIEVDPHLFWRIPNIVSKYPDSRWVHLYRNREACVRSLTKTSGIHDWMSLAYGGSVDVEGACGAYYDSVNGWMKSVVANMGCFRAVSMELEELPVKWGQFWKWIEADGDFEKSREELSVRYNAR